MEITKDLKRQIVDALHQQSRDLASNMGAALDLGAGTSSAIALRSPTDPKMAVYVFAASGPFTDDDIRAVRDAHMKLLQDVTMGVPTEVRSMVDKLIPPTADA